MKDKALLMMRRFRRDVFCGIEAREDAAQRAIVRLKRTETWKAYCEANAAAARHRHSEKMLRTWA